MCFLKISLVVVCRLDSQEAGCREKNYTFSACETSCNLIVVLEKKDQNYRTDKF